MKVTIKKRDETEVEYEDVHTVGPADNYPDDTLAIWMDDPDGPESEEKEWYALRGASIVKATV